MKLFLILLSILSLVLSSKIPLIKPAITDTGITVRPTNRTTIKNITEIVRAMECLRKAVETFADDKMRAQAYAALYQKAGSTNDTAVPYQVLVGYTGFYVDASDVIEAIVIDGTVRLKKDKSDSKATLYLLFQAGNQTATTLKYPSN